MPILYTREKYKKEKRKKKPNQTSCMHKLLIAFPIKPNIYRKYKYKYMLQINKSGMCRIRSVEYMCFFI